MPANGLSSRLPACLASTIVPHTGCLLAWLLCCLFLFFSLALYVTVLFEATRIQCNDDDDGNETTLLSEAVNAAGDKVIMFKLSLNYLGLYYTKGDGSLPP